MIYDPASGPWPDAYRLITGAVVPRPIAFVSTLAPNGTPNLAPFSFFTVVCANPLTICFSPMRRGPAAEKKDTLRHIEAGAGEFVVNLVDEGFADAMNLTSGDFLPGVNEFVAAGLTAVPSEVVAPPRVAESPINLECRRLQVVEVSDRPGGGSLVIGTVLRIHVRDELLENGSIRLDAWRPIARCGGATYTRATDTFELQRPTLDPEILAGGKG